MTVTPFDLPFDEAIAFFRHKDLQVTWNHDDMKREEHDTAFTVAKMLDLDLLKDVKQAVDDAISNGTTLKEFSEQLEPIMVEKGWWGRKDVVNPETGETENVQLGSPRRLKTIFRTNMQTAYAAGHWQQIQETKDAFPYLMYSARDDDRTRPEHADWDGTVLHADDDWWNTHFPPCGYNCRCWTVQLNDRMLERMGKDKPDRAPSNPPERWVDPHTGEDKLIPGGVDPGWDYAPGASVAGQLREILDRKIDDVEEAFGDDAPSRGELVDAAGLSAVETDDDEADQSESETTTPESETTEESGFEAPEPFQSSDDAKEWLEEHVADSVEPDGIPLEVLDATASQFGEIIAKHGLPKVPVITLDPDRIGFAVTNPGYLKFGGKLFADFESSSETLDDYITEIHGDHNMSTGSLVGWLAHEAAHYFELVGMKPEAKKALRDAYLDFNRAGEINEISDLATDDEYEFYAEVHAMIKDGRSVPPNILKRLRRLLP